MSLPDRAGSIARHEFRMMRHNPGLFLQLILMPLVMMAFLKGAFREALQGEGYAGANGAEQAVPGLTVMFAFFFSGDVAFAFFREHGWRTWDRLRASPASSVEIMVGKCAPSFSMLAVQQTLLLLMNAAIFGMHIRGPLPALFAMGIAIATCLLAMGMAAIAKNTQQLNLMGSLGAIALSGLGGAFTPLSALPQWARAVAPASPGYWAVRGYRTVILDGGGLTAIAPMVLMLGLFTLGFAAVAAFRFRFDEAKMALM